MRFRTVVLFLLTLSFPNLCQSQDHALEFVKQIGGGWHTDKFAWMSYVQFSSDGKMVASDAASGPEDISGISQYGAFQRGSLSSRFLFQSVACRTTGNTTPHLMRSESWPPGKS